MQKIKTSQEAVMRGMDNNSADNFVIYSDPRNPSGLKSSGSQLSEAETKMHTVPSKSGAK